MTPEDPPALELKLPWRVASLKGALVGSVMSGVGGQLAVVISGVIAARMLGPEDRGYLALLVLIPTALAQLGSLGLPLAITYQFSRDERLGRGALRSVCVPAVALVLTLVVIHAVILAILARDRPADVGIAAAITLLIIPAESAQLYGLAVIQGRRDFRALNVLRLQPALAYSVVAAFAFVVNAGSLPQFALWFTGTYLVASVITLTVALRRSPPRTIPGAAGAASMFNFGLRGLFGAVSPLETLRLDQAIVGLVLSPAALGLYVVGVAFTNLPRLVAHSIGVIAYPHITAERQPDAARRKMWRYATLSFVVCLAIVIPLEILAGWIVPAFFGDAFAPAVPITQILLVASLFLGTRRVLTDSSRGIGRPGPGALAEVASWVSLIPAIALLAPRFGAAGVAVAFTASAMVSLAVLIALLAGSKRSSGRPGHPAGEAIVAHR